MDEIGHKQLRFVENVRKTTGHTTRSRAHDTWDMRIWDHRVTRDTREDMGPWGGWAAREGHYPLGEEAEE
jgi:hypothetical protein